MPPWRLRYVGVSAEIFDGITKEAFEDLIVASNSRKIVSKDWFIEHLKSAWESRPNIKISGEHE
jgi:hypothetical protein